MDSFNSFHNRHCLMPFLCLALGLSLFIALQPSTAAAHPHLQDGNLLQNPGFEGQFSAWNGIPEIQVAAGWTPWWYEDPDHNPSYFRPEYKRAVAAVFPRRVFSGDSAQQWFTFHASHLAGMYQQVFNVTPGVRYRFTIWAQVWSSLEDNPVSSVQPANPHLQIGIDPTGGWSAGSPSVVWSPEGSMSGLIDQWASISVEATSENNIITVMMRTNPDFASKHNDMYWDNASLIAVQPPQPTLAPTNTPGPTATPSTATNTPLAVAATALPAATATATPTASDSPAPSATPTEAVSLTAPPTASPSETPTAKVTPTILSNEPADLAGFIPTPATIQIEEIDQTEADGGQPDPILIGTLIALAVLIGLVLVAIITWLRSGWVNQG